MTLTPNTQMVDATKARCTVPPLLPTAPREPFEKNHGIGSEPGDEQRHSHKQTALERVVLQQPRSEGTLAYRIPASIE